MKTFVEEDKVHTTISVPQMLLRLWPFAKRLPLLFSITVTSILGLALTSRLLPFLFGKAIDDGILKKDQAVVIQMAVLFLVVEVLRSLFEFAYAYFFQKFGQRILTQIRQHLTERVQNLPIDYFNRTPVGRIVTRLTNDTSTLSEAFSNGLLQIVTETVVVISIVIAMLFISVKLTLVTLIFAPIFLFVSYKLAQRLRVILRESKKQLATLSSYASEILGGIRVVQIYNRRGATLKKFGGQSRDYGNALMRSIRNSALLQPLMNIFNGLTLTAALSYGGYLTLDNAIPIGSLVAFLMHAQDLLPPLREILEKLQLFQNSLTSAERVFQMLDEKPEKIEAKIQELRLSGRLRFNKLSFRYADHLPEVLKSISLDIPAGSKMAVMGRTGSGKSTLVTLLQRFYEPPRGTIFVDDLAIESYPLRSLRRRIGVVQQDPFLFRGTLEENLRLGRGEIPREKLQLAIERIGYADFLKRTGRDLDSHVEERGANLSAGERQLISFARILIFEPDILILDEATANIDSQTEQLIQRATDEVTEGRTSLIVAHRLSTIEKCDQILVLENGELRERGSHTELMAKQGLYYQVASAGLKSTTI